MRTLNSSRLGLEASSGDILEAEAGAAPAGGLVTRTRATSGHYGPTSVERPRWSAERRASRSQGARDASQASPMRASQARTIRACSALRSLFARIARREPGKWRSPVRRRAQSGYPGPAQRWLLPKGRLRL